MLAKQTVLYLTKYVKKIIFKTPIKYKSNYFQGNFVRNYAAISRVKRLPLWDTKRSTLQENISVQ